MSKTKVDKRFSNHIIVYPLRGFKGFVVGYLYEVKISEFDTNVKYFKSNVEDYEMRLEELKQKSLNFN